MKRLALALFLTTTFTCMLSFSAFAAGSFYVIGLGPAGPEFLSRQAAGLIRKVDAVIVGENLGPRFRNFLAGKKVLFNPYDYHRRNFAALHPEWPDAKIKKELESARAQKAGLVLNMLKQGHDVAYLAAGDPNIFGSWRHWIKGFIPEDRVKVIPGISSFNSAAAALKRNLICNSSVVLATPDMVNENEPLVAALARGGDTMALFMALKKPSAYISKLARHYGPSTPLTVVYYAGYPHKEKVIKTTLAKAVSVITAEPEKYMGIVFVGPCLAAY